MWKQYRGITSSRPAWTTLSQINSKQFHEEFGIGIRQSSTFSGVGTYLPEKVPEELFSVDPYLEKSSAAELW